MVLPIRKLETRCIKPCSCCLSPSAGSKPLPHPKTDLCTNIVIRDFQSRENSVMACSFSHYLTSCILFKISMRISQEIYLAQVVLYAMQQSSCWENTKSQTSEVKGTLPSSGMRQHIASQVSYRVLKELTASIFEVQQSFVLNMEEASSSETLVPIRRTTRRYTPGGFALDTAMRISWPCYWHRHENLVALLLIPTWKSRGLAVDTDMKIWWPCCWYRHENLLALLLILTWESRGLAIDTDMRISWSCCWYRHDNLVALLLIPSWKSRGLAVDTVLRISWPCCWYRYDNLVVLLFIPTWQSRGLAVDTVLRISWPCCWYRHENLVVLLLIPTWQSRGLAVDTVLRISWPLSW
jgi:hypothetical protein